jgi:hypothetical protein
VDPPDGKIPLTPEALARRKDIIAKQEKIEYLDGRVLCLAPGIPRSTIPAPVVGYQILQKPGYVVIYYEQNHLYRTIPLDGRPPLDPNIRKAMGVSRGHWEGNVLVVDVTNFTNNLSNNWVIGAISATPGVPAESLTTGHGIPHSDLYRVTERYTPIDANTIHYEAKIEDPQVFTQPWTVAFYAFARAPKGYVPIEYACFEGNDKNLLLMTNTDISGIRVQVPRCDFRVFSAALIQHKGHRDQTGLGVRFDGLETIYRPGESRRDACNRVGRRTPCVLG